MYTMIGDNWTEKSSFIKIYHFNDNGPEEAAIGWAVDNKKKIQADLINYGGVLIRGHKGVTKKTFADILKKISVNHPVR
jgi:hypothetical protein